METNNKKLKQYFLEQLPPQEVEEIELQIISDADFSAELETAETELMEDYLENSLNAEETKLFETNYLITEQRNKKLQFLKSLKQFAQKKVQNVEIKNNSPSLFDSIKSVFNSRQFALGFGSLALILTIGVSGYLVWKNYYGQSDVLVALNKYQKNERPTEARISDFDYSPKTEGTRGGKRSEDLNLVSAKSRATEAVLKNQSAENLHELGRVYLAENKYDEAIKQFEQATKLNPNISKLHNDLGVSLLEKGKQKEEGKLELFAKANEEFSKSIELDRNLLDAYFNKALCIQNLNLPNQAKEAWEEYLKLDTKSQWAEEAKKRLQELENNKPISKTKDEILKEFFEAKQANDTERTWQIVSRNREMITGKLIAQQLTFLFVESKVNGDEVTAKKALDGLVFVGQLEVEKSGDLFWRDLAKYYSNLSSQKYFELKLAVEANFEGNQLSLINDFDHALEKFKIASELFTKNGNILETQISKNYIAYCLGYSKNKSNETEKEKLRLVNEIIGFSELHSYKWLQALGLTRMATIQNESSNFSAAIRFAEKSLSLSEECDDIYAEQRNLGILSSNYSRLGQKKKAIAITQILFEKMNNADNSLRQKWRNYFGATILFSSVQLYDVSRMFAKEGVAVAQQLNEPGVLSISQTQAGAISISTNNFSEARKLLNDGLQNAKTLPSEKARKNLVAYSLLKLADLEQKNGNHEKAAHLYDESFATNNSPYFEFEIQKGRLRSFLTTGNDIELEKQIPSTIKTAEENRAKILEEQQSNSFFDSENSVFEIAIEWEAKRGNFEKAYNYAESASARSLLELVIKNSGQINAQSNTEFNLNINTKPLELNEIQNQLPENVQLLQYSVLENKLLIWVITREKFIVKDSAILSRELHEKVEKYLSATVNSNDEAPIETTRLSQELYSILIQPIRDVLDQNKQICLIPNKVLFFLPFASLLSPQEKPFLAEFVISYSPSANIFIHCTKIAEKKEQSTNESILSVGNPAFDRNAFPALSNLTLAETEANSIAQYYDKPTILVGKMASKSAFKIDLANADVVHFAGHYLVKPDLPLDSSLLFANDGTDPEQSLLTNVELINDKPEHLKLVVLSSCESGVESYLNGEGMIGLSRTFLALDTPLVVASQWKVDSEATATLMKNFHKFRREQKLSTAMALRKAQLEMLNNDKFKSPYYWAAFASFGGYTSF